MRKVVYYHKDCLDGFGSAWAAWQKFGDMAEYIGLRRDDPPIDRSDSEMYFIDFTYPLPVMERLKGQGNRITALDHHISQESAVKTCHEYVYDLDRSGCVIAWEYFHPEKKVPELLKYIQDNDIYTLLLSHVHEINSALSLEEKTFANFTRLADRFETLSGQEECIAIGTVLLCARRKAVEILLQRADRVIFEGYETLIVNSYLHYSEAAAAIYRDLGYPMGMAWSYSDGKIHVSLRSDGVKFNCAEIAQKYGGGGHRGAAGFIFEFHGTFPWTPHQSLSSTYDSRDSVPSGTHGET